jgi:hypothetical protein
MDDGILRLWTNHNGEDQSLSSLATNKAKSCSIVMGKILGRLHSCHSQLLGVGLLHGTSVAEVGFNLETVLTLRLPPNDA